MNFVQSLFGKRHSGISQNQIDNLTPSHLLKPYQSDLDPSKVKQLPGFNVPAIKHDKVLAMATKAGAMQAEQGAKVLGEKVENAKKVLQAAAEIETKSAELVGAYGSYQTKRMQAEFAKQQANAQLGSAAADLATKHNQAAYSLQSAVDVAKLQIHLDADRYEKVGGF
ncbi:hypothetical protein PN499_23170 [Kamptonema animale CS-326]|jgi:hypothetical protein|uniref:hypothetical protein n=1 Tax=Kamptonema animale TaxID=92934 RepID=UPI00232D3B64|nr:hypothetical protein [Kamptonema animale]MDB9514106.1 hypothetical protein [Kamptonema animale CS-326]